MEGGVRARAQLGRWSSGSRRRGGVDLERSWSAVVSASRFMSTGAGGSKAAVGPGLEVWSGLLVSLTSVFCLPSFVLGLWSLTRPPLRGRSKERQRRVAWSVSWTPPPGDVETRWRSRFAKWRSRFARWRSHASITLREMAITRFVRWESYASRESDHTLREMAIRRFARWQSHASRDWQHTLREMAFTR